MSPIRNNHIRFDRVLHIFANSLLIIPCIEECQDVQSEHRYVGILSQTTDLLLPRSLLVIPLVDVFLVLLQLTFLQLKQPIVDELIPFLLQVLLSHILKWHLPIVLVRNQFCQTLVFFRCSSRLH